MSKSVFLIAFIFIFSLTGYGQDGSRGAGSASNLFLRSQISPRAAAFSGAFTAVSNDESALFYNPAGLANVYRGAVGFSHVQWFEDIRMDNVIFSYNYDRRLGWAVSVSHLWMPPLEGKDRFGQPTGEVNVSSSLVQLGFGYKVHPSFYIGLGIKYFNDRLADVSADGMAIDFGIFVHTFLRGLTLGVSVQNIGGTIQYDVAKEKIPWVLRGGLAYMVSNTGLQLSFDAVRAVDTDIYYAFGMEYNFRNMLALRLGNQFQSEKTLAPTFGTGFQIAGKYTVDYTFYTHNDLGATHRIGFTWRFDTPASRYVGYRHKTISKTKSLSVPQNVTIQLVSDRLLIIWRPVRGAQYNVYARTDAKSGWKRLNRHPLYANQMQFKKPRHKAVIHIVVTSVSGGRESDYSKEAVIDVK